jgi:hypothetical protein
MYESNEKIFKRKGKWYIKNNIEKTINATLGDNVHLLNLSVIVNFFILLNRLPGIANNSIGGITKYKILIWIMCKLNDK